MQRTLTPTQRLAEVSLGRPLADYVAEKRTARPRWTWKLIAEQLTEDTEGEITVTPEAIRGWYADDEESVA